MTTAHVPDVAFTGIKRMSVLGAAGASLAFAIYDGWLSSLHLQPNPYLFTIHRFVVSALLATWIVTDAQQAQRARPTLDHGGFALFLFLLYAPYYLISTRRGRGLLVFAGMVLLFVLPRLAEAIAAWVRSPR